MVDAGLPTPDFVAFTETAFKQLGAAEALGEIATRIGFPMVVKPADQGSALGLRIARDAAAVPGALVAAFSYSSKVLLERHIAGRDLAVSVLDGVALPIVEAVPEGGVYDFDARYEIGALDVRLPGRPARRRDGARPGAGGRACTSCWAAATSRASTCSATPTAACTCWRSTSSRA